jgi:YebC/PmpR family DNA-binding regulatory protein
MSGHSKWATIKRKKAAKDASRGKLFAKLVKAVEIAARQGGGDPTGNATLAAAIAKARASSVPVENIERAVKRGSGELDGADYEEIWYEGYGPGGVALFVQVLTDNRNRAASDVRSTFTRNGGNLGEPGSVGYLFEQKGQILLAGTSEDEVLVAAVDAGAEDVRPAGDLVEVVTAPSDLFEVQHALTGAGFAVESAETVQLPKSTVPLDASAAGRLLRLVDALEDLDDVQMVYANYDIDDEVMAGLAEA